VAAGAARRPGDSDPTGRRRREGRDGDLVTLPVALDDLAARLAAARSSVRIDSTPRDHL
jgi:hypothetical protein